MLSGLFSKKERINIPWKELKEVHQLNKVDEESSEKPVLIFKHSTRCSISAMALSRFERSFTEDPPFDLYYLDLIAYREISNEIAERYSVSHESPQVLLIKEGKATYDASHMGISFEELKAKAS